MLEFRRLGRNYAKNMKRMFSAVSNLYASYWSDFFHFAIFEDGESFEEALKKTHERYISEMHIQNSSEILDLACGRGGFTDLIAQNTKGNVLGVDISEAQLAHARSHQRKNLEFIACDIMHVNKLQRKFDAVSFLDAACYLPDKRKAIKKIANVVNPNGRFLLVDWCMRSGLSRMQEKIVLHPFMRFWAVPNLETQENYETYLQRYGFRVIDSSVLNDAARPNWEIGYKNAIKAVQELSFKDIYGLMTKGAGLKEGLRIISEQFPAALYIKAGFDSGFLQYVHILAEKSKS